MNISNPKNRSRLAAFNYLKAQLASGKKPLKKEGKTTKEMVDLTETDKKRIEAELEILQKRIVFPEN
jgi:hypothetical protein